MPRLADTPFSVLELAPIRDDGGPAEALHNALVLARHADMLGFTRFWVAEHHNMPGIASSATAVLVGHPPPVPRASASAPAASCCPTMRRW